MNDISPDISRFSEKHHLELKVIRQRGNVRLWDLSDGVACIEWGAAPLSRVEEPVMAMLESSLDELEQRGLAGLIILGGNEDFAAGSDINTLIEAIRRKDWKWLEADVLRRQNLNHRIRQNRYPVVAAVHGLTLGLGCGLAMHATRICAASNLKIGFSEVNSGLIPSSGGNKELLFRYSENMKSGGPFPPAWQTFEKIFTGWRSDSAASARQHHYLGRRDFIAANREDLLDLAKKTVSDIMRAGYNPPAPYMFTLPGEGGSLQIKLKLSEMHSAGEIDDHRRFIGEKLAHVVCGGNCLPSRPVSEEYLLGLSRECFISICQAPGTLERLEATLKERMYF